VSFFYAREEDKLDFVLCIDYCLVEGLGDVDPEQNGGLGEWEPLESFFER
jgi:hypothetical protein